MILLKEDYKEDIFLNASNVLLAKQNIQSLGCDFYL